MKVFVCRLFREELRRRYRLAALSNSNELHWKRSTDELRVDEMFEFVVSALC